MDEGADLDLEFLGGVVEEVAGDAYVEASDREADLVLVVDVRRGCVEESFCCFCCCCGC